MEEKNTAFMEVCLNKGVKLKLHTDWWKLLLCNYQAKYFFAQNIFALMVSIKIELEPFIGIRFELNRTIDL